MSHMRKPILSIGMIVKNEMRCLERCFHSLQPLRDAIPCELIVADTGSTDGSRELAEQYADLVFDFAWVNDFSAARNAVMDRCSGDWYLSIDADEFLDSDMEELISFLTSEVAHRADAATIVIRNYLSPDMEGEHTSFAAMRMLRMATGLRYQGSIHENWNLQKGDNYYHLSHTMLHHDGYAYADKKAAQAKSLRNLKLLEPEMERDPENGVRMLQCMESSTSSPEKAADFARRGMRMAMERSCRNWEYLSPTLARTAIRIAARYQLPERKEWLDWCQVNYPSDQEQSPFIEIDVAYDRLLYHYGMKDYEQAVQDGQEYMRGIHKKKAHAYDFRWSTLSNLYNAGTKMEQSAALMLGESLFRVGRHAEALGTLQEVDLSVAHPSIVVFWLDAMELLAGSEQAAEVMAQKYPVMITASEESERQRARRKAALKRISISFLPNQSIDRGWRLYRKLPDNLGAGARLMGASCVEEAYQVLGEITAWDEVPHPALSHAIELGAAFPESFYQRPVEELRELAVSLPRFDGDMAAHMLQWQRVGQETLKKLQFRFELAAAVIRGAHKDDRAQQKELCEYFLSVSRAYLYQLYQQNVLEHELDVLPGLHQGACHLLRFRAAEEQGNLREAVDELKLALRVAPALKHVVDFLLQQLERQQADASPELMEMANRVREILAQYAPDDPAVQALKQSEAYRRVAHLIEGVKAPVFGDLPQ